MRTNLQSNTWCRVPGCFPAIYFMETVVEHLSVAVGDTPAVFRQNNLYQTTRFGQLLLDLFASCRARLPPPAPKMTPMHQPAFYCSIGKLWTQFYTDVDYDTRMADIQAYNKANRWR